MNTQISGPILEQFGPNSPSQFTPHQKQQSKSDSHGLLEHRDTPLFPGSKLDHQHHSFPTQRYRRAQRSCVHCSCGPPARLHIRPSRCSRSSVSCLGNWKLLYSLRWLSHNGQLNCGHAKLRSVACWMSEQANILLPSARLGRTRDCPETLYCESQMICL